MGIWLLAFAPTLLLVALIVLTVVVVLNSRGDQATQLLEILRITVGWPVVALAVSVIFGLAFRDEIARSISRLAVKVGLSGVEISTQAEQPSPGPAEASLPAPNEAQGGPGPQGGGGAGAAQGLDAQLDAEKRISEWRMRMWWYWWLQNAIRSLVPRTVNVLRWLSGQPNGAATYQAYEQRWKPEVPAESAAGELGAILDILVRLDMIESPASRETLSLKAAGQKFLDWIDGKWNPVTDALP